jgi:hypothetical protein
MLNKFIAASLLVAMVAWAEMAMAPMFAMHAWQVHPAREMTEHIVAHHHVMPAGHPCCPELRKTENEVPIEFAAGSQPCDDQHRCCFRQGPQSIPAPVSTGHRLSQELVSAETAEPALGRDPESHFSAVTAVALGPPSLRGMVLRV